MVAARDLDERLAAVDRVLREIQAKLIPDRVPGEFEPPEEPPARAREGPLADVLARAPRAPDESDPGSPADGPAVSLLASMQEVLADLERALAQLREPDTHELTVSAGPFRSIDSVRAFERALGTLPGVLGVEVRGYEGEDRALIDVRLERQNT